MFKGNGMAEPAMLICHLLDSGHCLASEHHLIRGGPRRKLQVHSLVALLGHPTQGWLLWDTGYAPRMFDATRKFPYRLYRWATPLRLAPELAVVAQLPRFGLAPESIKRIVISHFHADHISGLRDFPRAELMAARAAYESIAGRSGFDALKRGFIPELLPADFERRANLLNEFVGPEVDGLGPSLDLFGDASALLLALPGHAQGQLGLFANTQLGKVLLIADACWMSEAFRTNTPPHWMARIITDNWAGMKQTLARLHDYNRLHPQVSIIPSHCPEAFSRFSGVQACHSPPI
jgi:glyoxylase-like metal-dependent hydrolase (beta-lactamase superfamily II)